MILKKHSTPTIRRLGALGPILYFPIMFAYLELVFHLYMKMPMQYTIIYVLFGISFGLLCSFLTQITRNRSFNRLFTYIIGFLGCLVYCIEMECKFILQSYYQLISSAETAANNKLLDYKEAIINGITAHWDGLFLFFLPFLLLVLLSHTLFTYRKIRLAPNLIVLSLGIVFHFLALSSLQLGWKEDTEFLPMNLYHTDKNIEDQVEKLGVLTMLRLDIKHSIVGVDTNVDLNDDFQVLNKTLGGTQKKPAPYTVTPSKPDATPDSSAEPAQDTSSNVMDIDFASLAKSAPNANVKWLDKYFASLEGTNKNKYTGMFKDYNVIFITAEGFSGYMIDKELTPTLYKLTHEGFHFTNFYTALHFTSTSGGECQNMVGLYPKNGNPISMQYIGSNKTYLPLTLANQLNKLNYDSEGYHCNGEMYGRSQSHPLLGYDWHQSGSGLTMEKNSNGKNLWPQSDYYLFEQTIDQYMKLPDDKRFNLYYLTLSGHLPYGFGSDQMAVKNADAVANLPYSEKTKAYIAANLELEKGLTYLLDSLEKAGKLDNTVICMAPDHIPYGDCDILEELAGKTFGADNLETLNEKNIDFDVYKNSLILWSGSMKEPVEVDKPCCQVDILPTLSNLLGLNYDSRLLMGSDILSDSPGLVHFCSNSWLTEKGLYNRFTGEFTPAKGVEMSHSEITEYVAAMKKIVSYKLKASELILTTDFYRTIPALAKD